MIDDRLRRELLAMAPEVDEKGAWENLQPRLRAARRRYVVGTMAAGGLVVAAIAFVLVQLLIRPLPEDPFVTSTTTTITTTTLATTTTSATTTSSSSTTTSSTTPTTIEDGASAFRFGDLEPGTYRSSRFDIDLLIDMGEGFSGIGELPHQVAMGRVSLDPQFGVGFEQAFSLLATRVDDPYRQVAAEVASERFVEVATSEAEIGGRPAIRIDARTDGAWIFSSLSPSDTEFVAAAGANPIRFYVVDAPTGTLVIWIEAPDAAFDDFLADVEAALGTVSFPPQP